MHLLHDSNSPVLTGFPTSRRPQNKQGTPRKTARMGKDFERVESVQDCARRGLHERPLLLEKCAVRSFDRRTRSSSALVVVKNTSTSILRQHLISHDAPQPFLCFCCLRAQKEDEVAKLSNIVDFLKEELNALKKTSPNADWPLLTPDADRSTKDSQPTSAR